LINRTQPPQERKARLAEEVVIFNVQEAYEFVQPQLANMGSVVGNPMLQRMLADTDTATHVIAEVGQTGGDAAHMLSSVTTGSARPGSLKKKGGDRRGNTPTERFKRPQAKDLEKIKVRVCASWSVCGSIPSLVHPPPSDKCMHACLSGDGEMVLGSREKFTGFLTLFPTHSTLFSLALRAHFFDSPACDGGPCMNGCVQGDPVELIMERVQQAADEGRDERMRRLQASHAAMAAKFAAEAGISRD
jgi:hypothetical protein